MERVRIWGRRGLAALAGLLACGWLFPQTIFRDCLQPVIPAEEDGQTQAEETLGAEAYRDLFRPSNSEYRLVFYFGRTVDEKNSR